MFESVNSVSRYDMVRQNFPDGYYPVSEVEFSRVIVTVVLNQFIFIGIDILVLQWALALTEIMFNEADESLSHLVT